jgi:hypothetical protein
MALIQDSCPSRTLSALSPPPLILGSFYVLLRPPWRGMCVPRSRGPVQRIHRRSFRMPRTRRRKEHLAAERGVARGVKSRCRQSRRVCAIALLRFVALTDDEVHIRRQTRAQTLPLLCTLAPGPVAGVRCPPSAVLHLRRLRTLAAPHARWWRGRQGRRWSRSQH